MEGNDMDMDRNFLLLPGIVQVALDRGEKPAQRLRRWRVRRTRDG
jgi:hypothetical protein